MADTDLTGFWRDVDDIHGEVLNRLQVVEAGTFWTDFSAELTSTRDATSRAGGEISAEGAFRGQAGQRFADRLAAGTKSINDWLAQNVGSIAALFTDYDNRIDYANGYLKDVLRTMNADGVGDHQAFVPQPRFGDNRDIVDAADFLHRQHVDLQNAANGLKARLAGVRAITWGGFGSQTGGPTGGPGYEQDVRIVPDRLSRHADEFTQHGNQPTRGDTTIVQAYQVSGPIIRTADLQLGPRSSAAITFQNAMRRGNTLAGETLRAAAAHFQHQDQRTYQQIMEALG